MISTPAVMRALELIRKGPANADYFFSRLTSPDWIQPLAAEGLFNPPYGARRSGEGYVFPVWTPGEYLSRMAQHPAAGQQVVEILRDLDESDNPRVYEVIADAAQAVSSDLATGLVPKVAEGLRLPFQLQLPEKVSDLIVKLNEAGLVEEAIQLLREAFAIVAAPSDGGDGEEAVQYPLPPKPRGRFDSWQYGRLLQRLVPQLVSPSGLRILNSLTDLLADAVEEGSRRPRQGSKDYSYLWRPEIAHPRPHGEDARDHLVSAVRDLGALLLNDSVPTLPAILRDLGARGSQIFDRIALFLLAHHGTEDLVLLEGWFDGPDSWSAEGLQPEFDQLLRAQFGHLPDGAKESYLSWVDAGPDLESYAEFRRSSTGSEPSATDLRVYREVWIRDRLSPLRDWLPKSRLEQLEALVELHGPSTPRRRGVSAGSLGERSPVTDDEILSLDWETLAEIAKQWSPRDEFDGPTRAGLEGSFRQRTSANPAEAVRHLGLLVEIDPGYQAAVLQALRDVVRAPGDEAFSWSALLSFLRGLVGYPGEIAANGGDRGRWLRKCVVSLVGEGLASSGQEIPSSLRSDVWEVIGSLVEDLDPTPDHEERFGGQNMDPATLSLNTVRGDAMHQVIRYALWWRRHLERIPDTVRLDSGFDELPEVRSVLERHLDPDIDPSDAVHSVYGQWFPWLWLLDREWAESHVDLVFPEGEADQPFFWSAWGAYVVYCEAYTDVLPLLRPKYAHAVRQLGLEPGEMGMGERSSEHLATHLMSYYWRGEVSLESSDLVADFFNVAPPNLREHALTSIGRGLWSLEEDISEDVASRLRGLWEWRVATTPSAEELKAFGWWFTSGKLDSEWSVRALREVLEQRVLPDPDHEVVARLASLAAADPQPALQCLERMISLSAGGWSIHGWLDHAKTILEIGLRASDPSTQAAAKRVVHALGAMQFQSFRELLKDIAPEDN